MDLSQIIAISGKPGLYLVISQSANSIIVENLENKRRMPAFATNKISALEDITMYTTEEDVPLGDIIQNIYDKEKGGAAISHKEDQKTLRKYVDSVLKNCDHDKVYDSDVKKLLQWYNLLQKSGILDEREKARLEAEKAEKKKESGEDKKVKKPAATKAKSSEAKKNTPDAKKTPKKKAPAKKKADK